MSLTALAYSLCILLTILGMVVRRGPMRQLLLLAASYCFYATFGTAFWAVLVISSVFNFGYGAFLRRQPTLARLWGGVGANVLLLGFFKTTHLLAAIGGAGSPSGEFLRGIAMPLGISFWTFQALSYLFDIYRQEEFDPSLIEFCLYLAFWPTVMMGPICRLQNMLPQFRAGERFSGSDLLIGLKRIVTGLFMKLVLSQLLVSGLVAGSGVAAGFDQAVLTSSGLDVWFLAIGFGFQLFFDFAGYSHMAIGAARIFGFRLDENFDAPFVSSTPSEFWNRWHMSLSSWIRDYVFVSIATARREAWWRYFTLLLSMTLFGLWHGAKSTFVLWGAYQGLLLIAHRLIQQRRRGMDWNPPAAVDGFLSWAVSFLAISLGWILFRASSFDRALTMFKSVLSPRSYLHPTLAPSYYALIIAVMLAYMGYQKIYDYASPRMLAALTPELKAGLAKWGLTRDFATFVWLIPMAAILFLGMLIADSGSEGMSTFVYAVF